MKKSRRKPAPGGRPFTVLVSLSEREVTLVAVAAACAQMARGAWVGQVAVLAAEQSAAAMRSAAPTRAAAAATLTVDDCGSRMQALMTTRAELTDTRRTLRNVGGNLNDVARHANSTGQLAAETRMVLALVARVVQRVDGCVAELDEVVSQLRREGLRPAPRRPAAR